MLKSPVFVGQHEVIKFFLTTWLRFEPVGFTLGFQDQRNNHWPLLGVKIRRKTMVVPATSSQTQWCLEGQGIGWWFQTCLIFHNMWDNPSHWRTHIFQDGYCTTNQLHIPEITKWGWVKNGQNLWHYHKPMKLPDDWGNTLWLCQQFAIENGDLEIVDFPSYKMVDLSSSLC